MPMTPISIYKKANDTVSNSQITLHEFLENVRNGKWQDYVLPIRAIKDDNARKEAKTKVPCVTISGIFKERKDIAITKHSGFIAIDIDKCDPNEVKSLITPDEYCYAAFTSISGSGVCVIFEIDGSKHAEAFEGIQEYLYDNYSVIIDPASRNPSRARFVSFDPDLYIRETRAKKFTHYPKIKEPKKQEPIIYVQSDFEYIIKQIQDRQLNICENYHEWLRCGFALADKFGESGRNYFHIISCYSSKYDTDTCNIQYNHCLKGTGSNKRTRINTLYYYCQQHQIDIYSDRTRNIINAATQGQKGNKSESEVAESLQQHEGIPQQESEPIIKQVFATKPPSAPQDDSLLTQVEQWLKHNYSLRRNEITRYIENNGKQIKQKDLNTIFVACHKIFPKIKYETLDRVINSDFTPDYNPFLEFIEKYKERRPVGLIDELFECLHTPDNVSCRHFGKKWLVGMIASMHGQHSPLVLVLCGEKQGTGKTEFFRRLLPDELKYYYAESKLDSGKDDEILMCQKILIMDDEYGGKSKRESARLKELTSKQMFSLREPYGRNNVDLKRLAVLAGTTNDSSILSDPTGNRRVIPVIIDSINQVKLNKIDRISLIIEAYRLWKNNYMWQLTKEDVNMLSEYGQDFENFSPEYELLNRYFTLPNEENEGAIEFLTTTDIKIELEQKSLQRLSMKILGLELKRIGFKRIAKKINGVSKYVYCIIKNTPLTQPKQEFF